MVLLIVIGEKLRNIMNSGGGEWPRDRCDNSDLAQRYLKNGNDSIIEGMGMAHMARASEGSRPELQFPPRCAKAFHPLFLFVGREGDLSLAARWVGQGRDRDRGVHIPKKITLLYACIKL